MAEAAMRLRALWSAAGKRYRLFVQGEAPREQLLRGFRDDGDAVLLGTASFWEGGGCAGHCAAAGHHREVAVCLAR
ncbi:MAG: hypothetical protein WDM77_03835 [Steroidobacteraceae bacterium]